MLHRKALRTLPVLLFLLLPALCAAAVPLLWEDQPLTGDRAEHARAAFGTRNGDTVVTGSFFSPSGRFAWAVRYGWDGTPLWERAWGEFGSAQVNAAAEAANGDLLFVGTGSVGSYTSDMLLFRTDPSGNVLWSRVLTGASGAVDMALRPDGSFVVVTGYYTNGKVSAFDGDGNPLWEYFPFGGAKFRSVVALPDGGVLAVGHKGLALGGNWLGGIYYYNCGAGGSASCGEGLAVRLRPDGSAEWSRSYPGIPATLLSGAAVEGDGFAVAGQTLQAAGTGPDVAVARLDPAGNLRWARFFGGHAVDQPAGVATTAGGSLLVLANSSSCGGSGFPWFALVGAGGERVWHQEAVPPANGKAWVMANNLTASPTGGYAVAATLSNGYFMNPAYPGDASDAHVSAWGPVDSRVPAESCNPFLAVPPPSAGGGPPPPPPRKAVRIDIKPGTDKVEVNPGNRGLVEVALFSDATFDASRVDLSSLRFAGASPKTGGDGKVVANRRDVDRDGRADLVVRFQPVPDQYGVVVSEELTGRTVDGTEFAGSDQVSWKARGPGR